MKPTLFDYSNTPDLSTERIAGFDLVILSPRANETSSNEVQQLRTDRKLAFWVQPFISTWQGKIVRGWDWDLGLANAVDDTHVLKNKEGDRLTISGHDISGVYVLDLRNPRVNKTFFHELRRLDAPILFDYGTFNLAWEPNLKEVEPHVWPEWSRNYRSVKLTINEDTGAWLQTHKSELPIPQAFEKVDRLLTVQDLYWRTGNSKPIIFWDSTAMHETIVALAHITDAHLGVIHGVYDQRRPIDVSLGDRISDNRLLDNMVIEAEFTKGKCVLNVGQETTSYLGRVLPPGRGSVIVETT